MDLQVNQLLQTSQMCALAEAAKIWRSALLDLVPVGVFQKEFFFLVGARGGVSS